jgi:DNA-binding response OmpR family regulator
MKRSILIVDDEFGLAELIAELLTESGFEATIAINGRLGLDSIARQRPDLVLLDVMMPVMNGPDMARAMRANPEQASIPILMMTSLPAALPPDLPRLYDVYLNKPFTPEAMFEAIEGLLAGPAEK